MDLTDRGTGVEQLEAATVQMLWDIEQIKQLKARYFRLQVDAHLPRRPDDR